MKRTSQALRRFGVPVLAATTLFSVGQVALGTTAFAATNGALTISNTPSFNTATAVGGTSNEADHTITWTAGTSSVNATSPQVLTITVTGSAKIVTPAVHTGTLAVAAGGQSATCTSTTPAGGPPATATCDYGVVDTVSEAVTSTVHDSTDTTTPDATATDNYASLLFSNCSAAGPQTSATCATQVANGASQTFTLTFLEAGTAAANVGINITLNPHAHTILTTPQPAGTTFNGGNTATCVTNAQGQCGISVTGTSVGTGDILDAQTSTNTGAYPASEAQEGINVVASTTAGRLVQTSSRRITPTSGQSAAGQDANMPGDAIENVYTLYPCLANTTTGNNACAADTSAPLSGVSVALTVDHGFFTPNCTGSLYTGCTFDPAPAAGAAVGSLKNSGNTMTVTTDTNGQFKVTLGIGRDSAFDTSGNLTAVVTGVANGVTLAESAGTGNTASTTKCNAVAQNSPFISNNNTAGSGNVPPQNGCPTGTPWTTNAIPLNGASLSINWLGKVPLSKTTTNQQQVNPNNDPNAPGTPIGSTINVFTMQATDQFGNLTSTGGGNISIVSSGGGQLGYCDGYQDTTQHLECDNARFHTGTISQPNGVVTYTIGNGTASYTGLFDSNGNDAQTRYWAWAGPNDVGLQKITATWNAPTTTFSTVTPAPFTLTTGTKAFTDTTQINYFIAKPTTFTFTSTPGNSVKAGTVVTVSATVKDQNGQGIANEGVQFIRSGPTTESGTSCSSGGTNQNTNSSGQAGFSFTCTNPSQQVVTIIVTDSSGNELSRGTQTINFTGTTPQGRRAIAAVIKCISPARHTVRCHVAEAPKIAGLTVTFYRQGGHRLGVSHTNSNGVAYFTIRNLKRHSWFAAFAKVAGTGKTKPATTNLNGVRVR